MTKEQYLQTLHLMYRIRAFESKALTFFEENKLRGSVHLCIGEEAAPATMANFISDSDYITSTHRGHGHCIAKGARLDKALCELMGKEDGYCGGRSGSMHIADFEKGNLGANAIVGGGYPIATGAALGIKMQKKDSIVVCWSGDSATNEGTFHEALNLASIWKLPVVFVCENNFYGISMSQEKHQNITKISDRAVSYGIPGVTVDGNDIFAAWFRVLAEYNIGVRRMRFAGLEEAAVYTDTEDGREYTGAELMNIGLVVDLQGDYRSRTWRLKKKA